MLQNSFVQLGKTSLRIVYYHLIKSENSEYYFKDKQIDAIEFENQIKFFKKHYKIIPLNLAIQLAKDGKNLSGYLVITFDDGFVECYELVFNILLKHNIQPTIFLISDCIDNKNLMWRNKLLIINKSSKLDSAVSELCLAEKIDHPKSKNFSLLNWSINSWKMSEKERYTDLLWEKTQEQSVSEYLERNPVYLSTRQIQEMSNHGFEFGSHSKTHPRFDKLEQDEIIRELKASINVIKKIIGKEVTSFSYPFGLCSPPNLEEKINEAINEPLIYLGTKNNLNNKKLSFHWERDNCEFNFSTMLFRFLLLPQLRKLKANL
ncbi:polysaccharide deacetylase family protein [Roseivirga seohaensis]|uniref:polysaccharide deacetylase family protein n=1 Tax=Roseivirga seohaensis TaxID=1914963 RepID=UPI003BAC9135